MFQPLKAKKREEQKNVVVELRDGRRIWGTISLSGGSTASDVLRQNTSEFVSVQTTDGEHAIHRDMIAAVLTEPKDGPLGDDDEAPADLWRDTEDDTFDPCRILGVRPGSSARELKDAWRRRMRQCHPDSVRARGFADHVVDAAQYQAQIVNRAYETLMGLRQPR
ncbi:MAG: J domain-containing protein [Pseudomonadota bacterium]